MQGYVFFIVGWQTKYEQNRMDRENLECRRSTNQGVPRMTVDQLRQRELF